MNKKLICLLLSLVMVMAFAMGVQANEEAAGVQTLTADVDGMEITADTVLDLNGYDVTNATVAQGATLQLMDSANDEYDASKCGSFSGTVNGTVEQVVKHDAKNYLVICEDGVYSAHRFYAGITSISLVPNQAALGYKAEYYADEKINAMVTGYGYAMWLNSYNPVTRMKDSSITDHELTLRVKNILRDGNEEMNAIGAAATIGGKAIIRFNVNGSELIVEGADYTTTLKEAVEAVNTSLGADRSAYTAEKIQAVRELLEKYNSYTNTWAQEYIFTEDKFVAVENVSITYGDALTLGQVFTAIEGVTIGENVTATVNGEAITVADNWADTALVLNAGEHEITITDNDLCWTAANTVVVTKADPTYTVPADLTAEVGQTLADIALPEGFAWVDSNQTIDTIGVHAYDAIYDLGDINYNTVEVEVSLIVKDHTIKERPIPTSGYPEGQVFTLGELFEADGYEIDSAKVTATVNGEELTVNASDWTATEICFDVAGIYDVNIVGGEYCLGASISLTVEAKQDKFVAKTVEPIVFGTSLTLGDLFEGTGINSKVTYTVNGETYTIIPNPTTANKWAAQEITFDAVGTYEITIVESILCNVATNTVTVVKADPTYTVPTGLTATYGDTLADVALTGGWSWKDSSASVGNAGTNSFTAVYTPDDTANYNTAEVEISVVVGKADPSYEVPTGLTATYGQTLANVTLPSGFAWKNSSTSVGNAGTNSFAAVYTPADTDNYNTVEVTVSVEVAKADPTYTVPTGLTATYGQILANVTLPSGFAWKDSSASVGNAGTNSFTAVYTPDDTANYNTVEVTISVEVAKADPTYTVPTGLTATYGQTLANVTLPSGFAWKNSSTSVGNAGTNSFVAVYTPDDTANYNTVEVTVSVEVAKADPTYTVPTGLTATYGQTLANVTLPSGFAWKDSSASVGNAGTNSFDAVYTPDDTANYNTVEVTVSVEVAKADPTYTVPTGLTATYGQTLVDVALTGGWSWKDSSASVGNAGTNSFAAVYTPADTDNYNTVEITVSVEVAKADPTYTVPTGLTATYGQTLANVTLPSGFAWKNSSTSVGNAGTNSFAAVYTPADTDNYNTVEVTVSVEVAKADPTYTVPTGLTATYGQTLANVTLPSGFAWKDSSASVGNAGTNSFAAVYTPDDTANYNTVEVTVSVEVAKADPTYTVPTGLTATEGQTLADVTLTGNWSWKDSSLSVGSAGTNSFIAVYNNGDANYNTVEVSVAVEVAAAKKVDKFDKVLTGDFLYRVGNENAVALSSLFKAVDGVEIGTVTATITNVAGDAAGTYTANSTWTAGTIQFSGTGVVEVTITDATSNPCTITLEVVSATNVTAYSGLGNRNSVLLNDITMSSGGSYSLSGGNTLYGNGFTLDMTNGTYAAGGNTSSNYVFNLAGANLDNVKIVGAVYTQYGATVQSEYNRAAVLTSGNCTITNSYISNCASAVRVKDGNLEIINSTIKGGNFANIDVRGGNVVLDNVTTINQVNGNDTAADGSVVVGLGVVVYYENVLNTTTVTIKNGITQYNVISETQYQTYLKDTNAQNLMKTVFTVSEVIYNDGTDKWVNTGILSMTADTVGDANISDVDGYIDATASLTGINGYVHTKVPEAANTTTSAPAYTSAGQGPIAPSYSFDYTNKNYMAKTDGSNDYCYYENGTVMLSMDAGDIFNWDTSILTATKVGQTLDYTVTMNDTDYTGKSIAFSEAGAYQVVYTYTDSNNYALDENGEVTTYSKTYTKTVHISVAAVEAAAKHAEFTMGSSGAATEKITVDNVTYISATGVTADNSTWTYMTIGDQKIYYPIIAAKLTSTKGSSTYAYFPVFENAVSITDYADSGTGDAFTYNASTTTLPSTLTAVKGVYKAASDVTNWSNLTNSNLTQSGASNIFKWASSSTAPSDPTTYNSVLCYKSPEISKDRVAYITLVQYSYTDSTGTTYYYYVGYTIAAFTYQACVTGDTLVTLANGSQVRVDQLTGTEQLLVWNHTTASYDVAPIAYIVNHDEQIGEHVVSVLHFADGSQIKIIEEHVFFDVDQNKYVAITRNNAQQFVGHSFAIMSENGLTTAELVKVEEIVEETGLYEVVTYKNITCFTNGILSASAYLDPILNIFDINPVTMGYENVAEDIATYGLYTYADFEGLIEEDAFELYNAAYLKIAVGKGHITWDDILDLIDIYFNVGVQPLSE